MSNNYLFKMTSKSSATPFSTCFGIFLNHLLKNPLDLSSKSEFYLDYLVSHLERYKKSRSKITDLVIDKPFLQLLCFTMSAITILDHKKIDCVKEIAIKIVPNDINEHIHRIRSLEGIPQSGNLAMCLAIIIIYLIENVDRKYQKMINVWLNLHLNSMNEIGFWGKPWKTHLSFQNGFHQY